MRLINQTGESTHVEAQSFGINSSQNRNSGHLNEVHFETTIARFQIAMTIR